VAIDTGGKSNWLTVDATGASSPRVLTLTADPTNLAPGSYTGNGDDYAGRRRRRRN